MREIERGRIKKKNKMSCYTTIARRLCGGTGREREEEREGGRDGDSSFSLVVMSSCHVTLSMSTPVV